MFIRESAGCFKVKISTSQVPAGKYISEIVLRVAWKRCFITLASAFEGHLTAKRAMSEPFKQNLEPLDIVAE